MSANTPKLMVQGSFATEGEANICSNRIIGGGIVQQQGDEWLVFSAKELQEKLREGPRKYHYLYIDSVSNLGKQSTRFIVESDVPWTAENRAKGYVRARNRNAPHFVGHFGNEWCNPSQDIARGNELCFIPCSRSLMMKMEEHDLNAEERAAILSLEMP